MIYNFPTVTAGQDLDSDLIAELGKHPNIVGTKLSCANIGKLHRLVTTYSSSEFAVFPGRSDVFLAGLLHGSTGSIAALVNLAPKVHRKVYNLFKEGKIEEAMNLQRLLAHGDWAIGKVGGIGGLKGYVVRYFGYGEGYVRNPLSPASHEKLDGEEHRLKELIDLERSL